MSGVYVVTAIEYTASAINADNIGVEVFAGFEAARTRALELLIFDYKPSSIHDPVMEDLLDGEAQWVFASTNTESVVITYRNIPGFSNAVFYDEYDLALGSLPGGFTNSNKPITMEYLIKFPHDVKSIYELSDFQKWALTVARIRRSPNYSVTLNRFNIIKQKEAISHLGVNPYNMSVFGDKIIEVECVPIENIRLISMRQV